MPSHVVFDDGGEARQHEKKRSRRKRHVNGAGVNDKAAYASKTYEEPKATVTFFDNDGEKGAADIAAALVEDDTQVSDTQITGQKRKRLKSSNGHTKEKDRRKELLLTQRMKLPIWQERDRILEAVSVNDVTIIEGETGSGKTTQIPQFIRDAGYASNGQIAITQPRRVAAINLAKRVADETGTTLGKSVGYSIRFEDVSSPSTIIKYVTDGMLLRELLSDPLLLKYSVIILDEAHERTLRTDILMGIIKRLIRQRKTQEKPALKVVVMSATLDAERFSQFFDDAPVLKVPGRQFPVKVLYTAEPKKDYIEASFRAIMQIHLEADPGDVLVFLTGQEDIESLDSVVQMHAAKLDDKQPKLLTCPIYAALPSHQQAKVFQPAPPNTRKVILATNIAETSITISGVRYVIDTGLGKLRGYDARIGIESLLVQPISKSSARQRAGRAGREAAGTCFRLYTEKDYLKLEENSQPEIQRCDLAFAVLNLKALGIDDVVGFDFMDRPDVQAIKRALLQSYALGALDDNGKITELGVTMSKFPLSPHLSKVMISSKTYGCTAEAIDIISLLSTDGNIFFNPSEKKQEAAVARKRFAHRDGDHLTSLNVLRAYLEQPPSEQMEWCRSLFINQRAMKGVLDIRKQLLGFCSRYDLDAKVSCGSDYDIVLQCFLEGFFQNVALLQPDKTYKSVMGHQEVKIHPSSVMMQRKVEAIMYNELVYTTRQYVRGVSAIQSAWLPRASPRLFGNVNM